MRTVLDITECSHSRGGVGRWVRGLALGLSLNSNEHFSIDLPETHPGVLCTVPGSISISPPPWMRVPYLRRFFLQRGMLEAGRADRIEREMGLPDIMHLSGVQPFGRGKIRVVTFFDHTPWTEPDSHTAHTLFYADRLKKLVDDGASVIAISGWAAEKAMELFKIPPCRVGCVGGAAEDFFKPGEPDLRILGDMDLTRKGYYLHVGSFVPRKNIPFLVNCFRRADTGGKKLVLAGAEKWGLHNTLPSGDVIVLESISDELLLDLYRGAEAVLVPSSEEGLGLPVLEALACGTPVICSDGGALPETVSGCGTILPVLDEEAWVDSLTGGVTEEMRAKAIGAFRPTWNEVGKRTLDFYRSQM